MDGEGCLGWWWVLGMWIVKGALVGGGNAGVEGGEVGVLVGVARLGKCIM